MTRRDDRPVFLVGFMGSGKSAVSRELAELLSWDFADTDDLVVAHEGRSIERIFRDSGEGGFREAEWLELQALAGRKRLVVATGGGLFLGVVQRRLMKQEGRTVWLDVPYEVARVRVGGSGGRPLWRPEEGEEALRAFFEKRRAAYALADLRVDGAAGTPSEVARRVRARLSTRSR